MEAGKVNGKVIERDVITNYGQSELIDTCHD